MAAAAVEQPMTAQERVLAANNPPTRAETHPPLSYQQRIAYNSRGTGVAVLFGAAPPPKNDPPPPAAKHVDPSEFLAGPVAPGHVKHGVRRYDEQNATTVGMALTEEWIRGRSEDDPILPHMVKKRGPRDNLEGPCCSVKSAEPKHRPLRNPGINNHPPTKVSPYYESEVPQEALPEQPHLGKRRFNVRDNGDILSTPLPDDGAAGSGNDGAGSQRRNRANESKDILNLGQYTPGQLNETERKLVYGPRGFTPQDLPPRKRSTIARVKVPANETHDIFAAYGTAGKNETAPMKKRNANESKHEALDIFDTTPLPQTKPKKQYCPSGLLDYNVPDVRVRRETKETRPAYSATASRQPEAKVETGSLFTPTAKNNKKTPPRGRARGTCVPKPNEIF